MAESSADKCAENAVHQKRRSDNSLDTELDIKFKKARFSWQIKGKADDSDAEGGTDADYELMQTIQPGKILNEPKPLTHKGSNSSHTIDEDTDSDKELIVDSMVCDGKDDPNQNNGSYSKPRVNNVPSDNDHNVNSTKASSEGITDSLKHVSSKTSDSKEIQKGDVNRNIPDNSNRRIPSLFNNFSQRTQQSRGININFDTARFNHRQPCNIASSMWQKQEVGCAIVDNVFNRTLEELGMSPDPQVNLQATTRLTVENRSIEAAISRQGLAVKTEEEDFESHSEDDDDDDDDEEDEKVDEQAARDDIKKTVRENDSSPKEYVSALLNNSCPTQTDSVFRSMLQGNFKTYRERKLQSCSSQDDTSEEPAPSEKSKYPQEEIHCDDINISNSKSACTSNLSIPKPLVKSVNDVLENELGTVRNFQNETLQSNRHEIYIPTEIRNSDFPDLAVTVQGAYNSVNNNTSIHASDEVNNRKDDKVNINGAIETYGDSASVLDLAVSTAILSQGLIMKDSG